MTKMKGNRLLKFGFFVLFVGLVVLNILTIAIATGPGQNYPNPFN